MDITGPFAASQTKNKYLLTFIDHATGFAEAYPIPDKTALSVYRCLKRDYIARNTPMDICVTDNGMEFRSLLIQDYLKELGVDVRRTCPWTPRSNAKLKEPCLDACVHPMVVVGLYQGPQTGKIDKSTWT